MIVTRPGAIPLSRVMCDGSHRAERDHSRHHFGAISLTLWRALNAIYDHLDQVCVCVCLTLSKLRCTRTLCTSIIICSSDDDMHKICAFLLTIVGPFNFQPLLYGTALQKEHPYTLIVGVAYHHYTAVVAQSMLSVATAGAIMKVATHKHPTLWSDS